MTTAKSISSILDRMYNIRSSIRKMYSYESSSNIYYLEEDIKNEITSILKDKCTIYINIKEFYISISLKENAKVSNRTIQTVFCRVDTIIRNYIKKSTFDGNIHEYIDNTNNSILDFYMLGNSIKFLL